MAASAKDFSALQGLHRSLKAEGEARTRVEAEKARVAAAAALEARLFQQSVGDVTTLPPSDRREPFRQPPEPIAKHHIADEQAALAESLSDDFSVETLMDTDAALSFGRTGIGPDTLKKLRRGHWVIQSQLDLHGLRTDEARTALAEYLRNVGRRGLRCVRIVHGKGLGSINREPVLKNKVRNWLVQKEEVIAFCQAKASDGGSGALVVLLKAQAKQH
ncbi:MAG: Smr/MutS family protein [Pseudomonadota bacterium]